MKTIKLLGLLCVVVFSACKKTDSIAPAQQPVVAEKITSIKSWFANSSNNVSRRTNKEKISPYTPDWDAGRFFPEEKRYLFPLKIAGAPTNVLQTLMVSTGANGEPLTAEYIFVRLDDLPGNFRAEEFKTRFAELIDAKDPPAKLRANILRFNIQGELISSTRIENGSIKVSQDKLTSKNTEAGRVAEAGQTCIDSYWITYLDGVIISIQYLGTTCFSNTGIPDEGGGSGGGNASNITCEQQQSVFLNAGHAATGEVTKQVLSSSPTQEQVLLKWKIFDAFTWFLYSYEEARMEKWYVIDPVTGAGSIKKKFLDFKHREVVATGFSIGGSRELSSAVATTNFNDDYASVVIDFAVKLQAICIPIINYSLPPTIKPYTATCIFAANMVAM